MKNSIKRTLSIALTIAMIFSLSAAVLAENSSEQPFSYYMCIGDSIPNAAYGDMHDVNGDGDEHDEDDWLFCAYPDLVSKYYGLGDNSLRYNGTHVGWRTSDVRYLLDDSFEGDDYLNFTEHTKNWACYTKADLDALKTEFRENLSRADLITINLGNNDIIGVMQLAIDEVLEYHCAGNELDQSIVKALEDAKQASSEYEYAAKLIDILAKLEDYTLLAKNLTECFYSILTEYYGNWDALMKSVLRWTKPDATIVVVGLYNPTGLTASGKMGVSDTAADLITALTNPGSELFNAYMQKGSPYARYYLYADIFDIDLTGSALSHPGQAGHRYIANQITSVVDKTLTCTHEYKDGVCVRCDKPDPSLYNPFTDVAADAYYHDAVLWAYHHEPMIAAGTTATSFDPDGVCTRAQIISFLWRANGCPEPAVTECSFTDVAPSSYYYKAVLWAIENGITVGYNDKLFGSDDKVTRAQAVTFLWRAFGSQLPTDLGSLFTDISPSSYCYYAVLWAASKGVAGGYTPAFFGADDGCTRAQIVSFLYRLLG